MAQIEEPVQVEPVMQPVSLPAEKLTIEEESKQVEMEVEMALEKMIYTFLGVLIVAVVVGTAIGGMCVLCIGKCCNRSQKRRLEATRRRSEFHFRADSAAIGATQEGVTLDFSHA